MGRDRIAWVLPVVALVAVLPLMLHGPSCGHDFDFHILSWFEAAAQFAHGNLHPQWAYSPAFNAGEPRFLFYPPISWMVGGLLGLGLGHVAGGWTAAPVVFTWVTLTLSGMTMYRLARGFAGAGVSLVVASFYLANPYMLFTAYERTAYAELLAAAWMPLLLWGILKARLTVAGIAVPVGLLWLTNAPAAVMGTYALALLAVMRLVSLGRGEGRAAVGRMAVTVAGGTVLGFGLAAFYVYPAAVERPFVQIAMVVVPGMRIDDNTLFHHTGVSEDALLHDAVLHTASVLAVILLVMTLGALAAAWLRAKDAKVLALGVLAVVVGGLLTPLSLPIWRHAPELAFLQFPWRLLAVLGAVLGCALAMSFRDLNVRTWVAVFVALVMVGGLTYWAAPVFRQGCDVEDTVAARLRVFEAHAGAEATDEYTPQTADNEALKDGNPAFWLAKDGEAAAGPGVAGVAPDDFTVVSPMAQNLIVNRREYPDWRVMVNGREIRVPAVRQDGLMVFPVGAGVTHVEMRFREDGKERAAGAVSALGLAVLIGLGLRGRRGRVSSRSDE